MEARLTRHARALARSAICSAMDLGVKSIDVGHLFAGFHLSPAPHAAALLRDHGRSINYICHPDLPMHESLAEIDTTPGVNILYAPLAWQLFSGAARIAADCHRLQIGTGDLLGSMADLPFPVFPRFLSELGFMPGTGTSFVTDYPEEMGGETQDTFIH